MSELIEKIKDTNGLILPRTHARGFIWGLDKAINVINDSPQLLVSHYLSTKTPLTVENVTGLLGEPENPPFRHYWHKQIGKTIIRVEIWDKENLLDLDSYIDVYIYNEGRKGLRQPLRDIHSFEQLYLCYMMLGGVK